MYCCSRLIIFQNFTYRWGALVARDFDDWIVGIGRLWLAGSAVEGGVAGCGRYYQGYGIWPLSWQSVFPLGGAHRLTMDGEYKGYFMPKGSTVFLNTWELLRDEEYYPDSDTFNPERFLKNGDINPKTLDPIPNFGFGRRICPGRFFAMDSLLMSIASTLCCFDTTKAKDSQGRDVEPDVRWDPGFTRHIMPFECSITPRSPEAVKLLRGFESTEKAVLC
ncbi:cytochrome P450 family protein [Pleurotus pulmonarius]